MPQFDAYPVLPPTTTFPPVKLDEGLYYVNAFEPYVLPPLSPDREHLTNASAPSALLG